jgi:DNA-binding SARP family transcriptional activator
VIHRHPKKLAVLTYLACQHEEPWCHRESLLPVFWPNADESQARNSLRQCVHVLRRMLGEGMLNGRDEGRLSIDGSRFRCDVADFGRARREGRLQDALELQSGDFLTGFYVANTGPFMAWADRSRRTLRERGKDCALRLAQSAEADRDLYQAVAWWTRALELSPYDEEVLSSLVWALVQSGNRGSASQVYRRFRNRMMDDLELEPSAKTRAAVDRALNTTPLVIPGSPVHPPSEPPSAEPPSPNP